MSGKNTLVRKIRTASLFESAIGVIPSDLSFNQGDLLAFDDSANAIIKPTAESEGAQFLGIAPVTVVNGKIPNPYNTPVDASQAAFELPGPQFGDVHKCLLEPGVTITPGDQIFLSPANGPRFVTNTGTKAIGTYDGRVAVLGGATDQPTEVDCLIGSRWPNDVLKF